MARFPSQGRNRVLRFIGLKERFAKNSRHFFLVPGNNLKISNIFGFGTSPFSADGTRLIKTDNAGTSGATVTMSGKSENLVDLAYH